MLSLQKPDCAELECCTIIMVARSLYRMSQLIPPWSLDSLLLCYISLVSRSAVSIRGKVAIILVHGTFSLPLDLSTTMLIRNSWYVKLIDSYCTSAEVNQLFWLYILTIVQKKEHKTSLLIWQAEEGAKERR